ncbi:MAG TPA: hypothetical protein VIX59_08770 [Candidatus Binataceae bacterium]
MKFSRLLRLFLKLLATCTVAAFPIISFAGQGLAQSPLGSGLSWQIIGPQPIVNEEANFFPGQDVPPTFNSTGRVTAIAPDPNVKGQLFIGTAGGGVWKSTDGGSTFVPITDQINPAQPVLSIGSIALDSRSSPTVLYVGTGEADNGDSQYGQGIYKSTDSGNTWTKLGGTVLDRQSIGRLALDFSQTPPTIYAAATVGETVNHAGARLIEGAPANDGLYKSTDGGTTFGQYASSTFGGCVNTQNGSAPCAADDVSVVSDGQRNDIVAAIDGIGAAAGAGVYRSTDGGVTWSAKITQGLSGIPIGRISLAAQGPNVYAMVGDSSGDAYSGFFVSSDSGNTWTSKVVPCAMSKGSVIDGTAGTNSSCLAASTYSQSFFDQALAVSPVSPSTVFFGGVGLYESTDAGSTWTPLVGGGTHADQHALQFDPFTSSTLYIGNDGGLFSFATTNNPNNTFVALNNGLSVGQLYGIGQQQSAQAPVLGGFQDHGIDIQSAFGALIWNSVQGGDGAFPAFAPELTLPSQDAFHSFLSTSPGSSILATSTDGGLTWDATDPTNLINAAMASAKDPGANPFMPISAGVSTYLAGHFLYFLNPFGSGQVSTKDLTGGCVDRTCAVQDIEVSPSNFRNIYTLSVGTTSTPFQVYNSSNSGQTWSNITPTLPGTTQATGITPDPLNSAIVYLTLAGFTNGSGGTGVHHIYAGTVDQVFGTATWKPMDGNLPDVPVLRLLPVPTRGQGGTTSFLAGTDAGIYRTGTSGATWHDFSQGIVPHAPVIDLSENQQQEIVIATHGRGAYRLPPPVAFRDVLASEQCDAGSGDCFPAINYPKQTVLGDTLVAFVLTGGEHPRSDLTFPSSWTLDGYSEVASSGGITAWALHHLVTTVVTSDQFHILNSSIDEAFIMTADYSGVSATTGPITAVFNQSSGTSYVAPSMQASAGDVVVQWFINLATGKAPDGKSPEAYEDKFGYFNTWTVQSGPTQRYGVGIRDDQALTDLSITTNGTYGPWTAVAGSLEPIGAPLPPPPAGNGFAWSVVLPAAL